MRGNVHVRFGGRGGETDRRQRRHRAPSRPSAVTPRLVCVTTASAWGGSASRVELAIDATARGLLCAL
jgi:hypothetical protein